MFEMFEMIEPVKKFQEIFGKLPNIVDEKRAKLLFDNTEFILTKIDQERILLEILDETTKAEEWNVIKTNKTNLWKIFDNYLAEVYF